MKPLLLILAMLPAATMAQLRWQPSASHNEGLPEGANFEEMAKVFADLHCVAALNLVGGGSSAHYVNDRNTIKPSDPAGPRPVPAVLVLCRK